jgi:hypothetical protein
LTPPTNWGIHESRFRFDIHAERQEYERLFQHQARALQDRLVRRSRTDRHQETCYYGVGKVLSDTSSGSEIAASGSSAWVGQREKILLRTYKGFY